MKEESRDMIFFLLIKCSNLLTISLLSPSVISLGCPIVYHDNIDLALFDR